MTEMRRLIDEAQAALDDHFRPRLVVDNKAQLNMTDLVERLRLYNGGYGFAAEQMREAADEIERLRAVLRAVMDETDLDGAVGLARYALGGDK